MFNILEDGNCERHHRVDELLNAQTHDPSEGFRQELAKALDYLGAGDADLGA